MVLTLGAMLALHVAVPIVSLIHPPYSYLGVIPILFGLVISGTSARAFREAGTPVIPFEKSTALVTDGWYRYTRNPMYLGLVVTLVGVWLVLGTLSPLLPMIVFVWIIEVQFIRGEEQFLNEIFGEQYRSYKLRVRRWL
jgi:protein-S-isoprenylcysteine O-methyltransferase Ste14